MGKESEREFGEEFNGLDLLLRRALVPAEEPDDRLNQKILNSAYQKGLASGAEEGHKRFRNVLRARRMGEGMENRKIGRNGMEKRSRRRMPAVALAAAIMVGAGSLTAYGAYRYLALDKAAEEMGDRALVEAFSSDGATVIDETQSYEGYDVTLMGIVSGEALSERERVSGGVVREDRTYAMVAIARSDGSPMPDFAEPGEPEDGRDFFVSPLIGGYDPASYNVVTLRGNYSEMLLDGVVYRLLECDNVEIFADHELYLCVIGGRSFYDKDAYSFDSETGEITRNPAYQGLNALFRLPADAAKADPVRAGAYMEELWTADRTLSKEAGKIELGDDFSVEAESGNDKGAEAAEYALRFVGNPYVWGGESLTEGCDSSGFVKGIYEYFGVSLPHSAALQKGYGEEVDGLEAARPGDLIFYENPSHVGVYIGGNMIVHADTQNGICVSAADFDEAVSVRRIF